MKSAQTTAAVEAISDFIQRAREENVSHETIRRLLLSAGWKDKEICNQLAAIEIGTPIPTARGKGGARESFLFLTAFTCLYVAAVAYVLLVFNLIDLTLPDVTREYWSNEWIYSSIRSMVATVIVFFPLYFVFNWLIYRDTIAGKIIVGSAVERWLTYVTYFAAILTALIDATTLMYWFLEGELTVRLLLKAIVLLTVMFGVFGYLWIGSLRWSPHKKTNVST